MAKIRVKPDRCKGCGLCVPQCPHACIVMSKETNDQGHNYPEIDEDECKACRLCCIMCPDFAIVIEK